MFDSGVVAELLRMEPRLEQMRRAQLNLKCIVMIRRLNIQPNAASRHLGESGILRQSR